MPESDLTDSSFAPASATFATTHWSVVFSAAHNQWPGAAEALNRLCQTYWYPLYGFLRRHGHKEEDARDLVQGFFAQILGNEFLGDAARERGKFRSFLLASLNYYVADQRARASRLKRGGGEPAFSLDAVEAEERYRYEPADELSPDKLFDRRWALALIERTLAKLEAEFAAGGKQASFLELRRFLPGGDADSTHAEVAARLGATEGAVKVAVHRLRQRFGQLFREEISQTVVSPVQVDEEIQHLLAALGG
jgi:DNA-directed RNA polymerase specialized sigma24 family protein